MLYAIKRYSGETNMTYTVFTTTNRRLAEAGAAHRRASRPLGSSDNYWVTTING